MSRVVTTPTLRLEGLLLAGTKEHPLATIDAALDVVIYEDSDWEIERCGLLVGTRPFGIHWLAERKPTAGKSEGFLSTIICDVAREIDDNAERIDEMVAAILQSGDHAS